MKKILFVNNNLETGGVQTSLINLLKEIHDTYDVSLLLFQYKEEYRKMLPENVKILTVKSSFKHFGMTAAEARKKPFAYVARAFWVFLSKMIGRSFAIRLMSLTQKKVGEYDYAISYLHEAPQKNLYGGCNEFLLRRVNATKKIAWLHCDFGLCGANNKQSRRIYRKMDKIVACSEGSRQSFIRCMPEFADKTIAIRNCNDYDAIREKAGEGISYGAEAFHIVTVARLAAEKGIERALRAIHFCKTKGYRIKYHLVGSGPCEAALRAEVEMLGLTEDVIFYGNQKNPYPYIKNANLFLLPSYHEAAPMVFDEAACLGVPALATSTTSTEEMIVQSGNGIAAENTQASLNEKLLFALEHPDILDTIRQRLSIKEFHNRTQILQLKALFQ